MEHQRTVVGQADGGGEVLWSRRLTDAIYTSAGLTMPSGRLAAGTYLNPPRQLEVHDVVGDGTPTWSSEYDAGGGAYQDVIWDLAITTDGGHCAVASWGDQLDTNPELHVFARSGPTAIFTLDTPGSLFAADIARGAGGALTVTAAGKHVHANQSGRGGDLYAVRIPIACAADLDAGGSVGFEDLLRILAAWGPCANCPEDLDASGSVDFPDILAVLSAWGPCE